MAEITAEDMEKFVIDVFGSAKEDNLANLKGYELIHKKVKLAFGPAGNYCCVDCGKPAKQWSYTNNDEYEAVNDKGRKYGSTIYHYVPRCFPCHVDFDRACNGKLLRPPTCKHDLYIPILVRENYTFKHCYRCTSYRLERIK